jgi:hypothetical protein
MADRIPTPGRIVHVFMSEELARRVNRGRTDAGHATKTGNTAREGDVLPMVIVRVQSDTPEAMVNGQVFLDGNDTLWATSIRRNESPAGTPREPGTWDWPDIV